MIVIVDIEDPDNHLTDQIIRRRLFGEPNAVIQVQGYRATVLGEVKSEFEALVPYIVEGRK